jgi:hypothetical protein
MAALSKMIMQFYSGIWTKYAYTNDMHIHDIEFIIICPNI